MFAFYATGEASPTTRFLFAAFYYLIGVLVIVGMFRRGRMKWRGGAEASTFTCIAMIILSAVWGTTSLGAGLGWSFCIQHELPLRVIPAVFVAIMFGIDHLRQSRSRLGP